MAVSVAGNVLVAVGLGIAMLVVIQNAYAAANITVEHGQKLATTGFYALVRHPMYFGNVIMMIGIPLALGSYWGLASIIPGLIVLGLRINDEEAMLGKNSTVIASTRRKCTTGWCHTCGKAPCPLTLRRGRRLLALCRPLSKSQRRKTRLIGTKLSPARAHLGVSVVAWNC